VLVLTARGSWHEKIQGIDGGADDYMAKPFRIEEVLARRADPPRQRPGDAGAAQRRADARSARGARHPRRRTGEVDQPRHLAHARAAASGATPGARCSVRASAEGLSRTLQRLHAGRGIAIDVAFVGNQMVRAQREDLDEMLGNLLDNACKWARTRVFVDASANGAGILITVDDDGPGLEPGMWEAVLQRGVRADQAAPGSGFGLAIVRDLAELYGGSIALEKAPIDGVRARLQLPGDSRLI
jgi:signal transduction histidine kinase